MMVADTSALMAILMNESEGPSFYHAMVSDGIILVSTATAVELMIVAMGKGDAFYQSAVLFLEKPFIRLMPLDETQLWAAVRAYQSFGKGRHPASLNFGDTFSYALATTRQLPLLFKGDDFVQTGIRSAV
jgi:ribonuclease VapC